jgi:hypothetical protein
MNAPEQCKKIYKKSALKGPALSFSYKKTISSAQALEFFQNLNKIIDPSIGSYFTNRIVMAMTEK